MRLPTSLLSVPTLAGVGFLVAGLLAGPSLAQDHAGHDHAAPPVVSSEEPSQKELMSNLAASNIVFKSETVSVGEILDIETVDLEFEFRNTGSEALEIRFIKPSCGCTVPELEKTTFEPNERGTIKVTFDPKGKTNRTTRVITVYTNSKMKPVHQIYVDAFVNPVVVTTPNIVSFSMLEKGAGATQTLDVLGRFPEFKVTRVTTTDPEVFAVDVEHVGEVDTYGKPMYLSRVHVTLLESARPDNHRTELVIRTNDERKPLYSVAAVGRVIGDLELMPVRMTLGRLVVGDEFERDVIVRSRAGRAFEIKAVTGNIAAIDAEYTFEPVDPEKRDQWVIRAQGKILAAAPRFNAPLMVATDVPEEELMRIQMYGQLIND